MQMGMRFETEPATSTWNERDMNFENKKAVATFFHVEALMKSQRW